MKMEVRFSNLETGELGKKNLDSFSLYPEETCFIDSTDICYFLFTYKNLKCALRVPVNSNFDSFSSNTSLLEKKTTIQSVARLARDTERSHLGGKSACVHVL